MASTSPESERLSALRRYRILDTAPEPAFDEIVHMAACLFDAPMAMISLVDEDRQWLKASIGREVRETGRDSAFCTWTIRADGVLVVPDARVDTRFARNPLVVGSPGIRFYAAAPLLTRDGHALGTLCVMDTRPRQSPTVQARDALATLARLVVAELDIRLAKLEAARWTERLERLTTAAIDLARCADGGDMLRLAAEQVLALFGAEASRIRFHTAGVEGREPEVVAARADLLAQGFDEETAPLVSLLESAVRHRQGVVRFDRAGLAEQAAALGWAPPFTGANHGWMAAPLRQGSSPALGSIAVAGSKPFDARDEALFVQCAELLAGAFGNRMLFDRMQTAEARFRGLFQCAPDPMWVFDRRTLEFLEVNEAAIDHYGWSREEFRGMTILDLRASQDVPRLLEVIGSMEGPMRHHGEWRHLNRHGEVLHVLVAAYYGLELDGREAVLTVAHDITERKRMEQVLAESEARFRHLADSMPAMLWLDDTDGNTIFVNRPWLDYSGRHLEDEVGDGWQELLHPDERAKIAALIRDACARRAPYSTEYRLRGRDCSYRWFLDSATPRFATDGSFLGMVGLLIDMTDRRRLEAEIRQFQNLDAMGRLSGGIAHDFNNLLGIILGNSELIAERTQDENLRRLADTTGKAADRAAELVRRLLAFSRGSSARPVATDTNALIAGLREMLIRTLGDGIELSLELQADPWTAHIDPQHLETALLNLALNARDAMPGGGRLAVRTTNVVMPGEPGGDPARQYLCIAVTDTGTGMDEAVRARAFDPFFTTKEVGKGTGLGLSMVYGFARQSGGRVEVASEIGAGTTVRLWLPRATATSAAAARPDTAHSGTAHPDTAGDRQPGAGEGRTILLVEDEQPVRALVAEQLAALGYAVEAAENGPAALALLRERPDIDLLLTDVMMPQGMSGRHLAVAARALRAGLPVLLMSGYAEDGATADRAGAGWLPLLRKPFTRQALADAIRDAFTPRAA